MGMRQMDVIAISGKTQDAAQAQQATVRAHGNLQDQLAVQQSARAHLAAEQVAAAAPADRLELSTQGEPGSSGDAGGGDADGPAPDEQESDIEDAGGDSANSPTERHIDFLA